MKYNSNAKINLGLRILDKRDDGYHNLESILIEIDFHDTLIFTKSSKFQISSNVDSIPLNKDNIVYKTYELMKIIANPIQQYSIFIEKNIPLGSGLGGGSSNAALTLKILNKLWNIKLSNNKLINISKKLGSDVPFFINGGIQFIEGRGHKSTQVSSDLCNSLVFLLVFPEFSISTKWAFNNYNFKKKSLFDNYSINKFPTLSKTLDWKFFINDFEEMINQTYPEIGVIKNKLIKLGACYASLSGSGSTMFGVFDNYEKAEKAASCLSPYITTISKPH